MKRRKVLAMLMTAVMTFTSVAPQSAIMVQAEDSVVIESVSENEDAETVSDDAVVEEEETTVSADAVEAGSEEAAEENEAQAEESGLPAGIKGMPEGYVLSDQALSIKKNAAANDVAKMTAAAVEGKDYVKDKAFFLADDEEYAKTVAEAYNAELESYDGYVAVIDLSNSGLTVAEAVAVGADISNNMPVIEADYIVTVETGYENMTQEEIDEYRSYIYKNTENGWLDEVYKMAKPDPNLLPGSLNYQWWHDAVGSYGAWGVNGYDFSGSGIKVAVIDTGVNTAHEDFKGHITADGNDLNGHGSNVAGIIGATANNGKGGSGIAPGVQILGYTCGVDEKGSLDSAKILSSIKKAADDGADIINMSLGGPFYSAAEVEAINYAYEKGVTIIAAAGNDSSNSVHYPACYDHVISVAATQPDGSLTTFSNFGDQLFDIAAPGADMMSCNAGAADSYVKMQGTSQATPVVAGACALYMSIAGHVSPDEMEQILKSSATKTSAKGDGAGIVNVAAMLKADTTGPKITVVDASGATVEVAGGTTGSATVFADAVLNLTAMNFNGHEASNEDTQIFFTVNGKAPAFEKSGMAKYGTYQCTDGKLNVNSYPISIYANGGKCTLKAQAVTAMGISSKITTINIIVNEGELSGLNIEAPVSLAAGTSYKLNARLTRKSGTAESYTLISKGVTWSIEEGADAASIGKTDGKIKVNKNATGKVTVKAVYDGKEATATIAVGLAPVKKITISENDLTLSYNKDSEVLGTTREKRISIQSVVDANGNDITAEKVQFSWASSDTRVVRVNSIGELGKNATLRASGKGKAKVTVTAMDGSGTKAVINVTVIRLVTRISVIGQSNIAQGASAGYKVVVTPSEANYKDVSWSVEPITGTTPVADVTIDTKGNVNVGAGAALGAFNVVATATDGSGVTAKKRVKVVAAKAKSVTLTTEETNDAYKIKSKKGSVTSVQLFTVNTPTNPVDETRIKVKLDWGNKAQFTYKSSNYSVADVNGINAEDGTATIMAFGKGSAKITFEASDGSGKKAVIKVNVIVPVSHLQFSTPVLGTYADSTGKAETNTSLAIGAKTKTKVTVGESYGKVSNKKVNWSIEPVYVGLDENEEYIFADMDEAKAKEVLKSKLISGSNGTVQFNKNYVKMYAQYMAGDYYFIGIRQTATAADGSGVSVSRVFLPSAKVAKVVAMNGKGQYAGTVNYYVDAQEHFEAAVMSNGNVVAVPIGWDGPGYADFNVTSSDPTICTGYYKYSDTCQGYVIVSWGSKKGKVTLTVTAKDGSKQKCKIVMEVK